MRLEKILFVRTYAAVTHHSLCPPLGLMYLASSLRNSLEGQRRIRLVDMRLKPMTLSDMHEELERFQPDLVGISSLSHEGGTLHGVSRLAKEANPDCLVLAGGPHASMFFDKVLEDRNVDAAVVGEGEQTAADLIKAYESGGDVAVIPGVATRSDTGGVRLVPGAFLENLDCLPFPSWDLVDVAGYAKRPNMNSMLKRRRYMAILTSRGCPYGCAYCHNLFGRGFRFRSPENVFREMEVLCNEHGVEEFHVVDDIFNLDKERAHAICDLIIQNRLNVSFAFPNGLRGDILDRDLIRKMVRAGCYAMTYAVETASPRLQKLLHKNVDLQKLERAIAWSYEAGVITKGFFMLGFPTESLAEIQRTISYAVHSRLLLAGFFCVVPFPRTSLFELATTESPTWSPSLEECFYYAEVPYYTQKTGVDLRAIQRQANRSFYLNPRRLAVLLSRIPRKRDLLGNLVPFLQLAFSRLVPSRRKTSAEPA
jgi:anaerobic magnesium-protoporphyrin IX monomethyl ester cyclase